MRRVVAGLVSLIVTTGAAMAADLEVIDAPEIDATEVDPARFGWGGVYGGVSGGYGWLNDVDRQFAVPLVDGGQDWVYGGHVGYLHEFNGGVVGAEFEAMKLDITYRKFNFITVDEGYTVKLRGGMAWDRLLATGNIGATYSTTNIGLKGWGLALGVGLDYAVTDHITVGAQYTHHDFRRFAGTLIDATVDIATARVGFKF